MPKPAIDKVVLNPKDPIIDTVAAALRPVVPQPGRDRTVAIVAIAAMLDAGWTPPTPEQAAHIEAEDARVAAEIEEARRG